MFIVIGVCQLQVMSYILKIFIFDAVFELKQAPVIFGRTNVYTFFFAFFCEEILP
jgi:hypothetical protein